MSDTVETNTGTATETSEPTAQVETSETASAETINTSENDGKVADADNNNPEAFSFDKLELPEGITATDEQRESFTNDLNSIGITSQEGAQKFLNWILEKAQGAENELANQQKEDMGNLEKKWIEAGKKDPVLGKDYDGNVSSALETISKIFSQHTVDFLKDTSFIHNPDFLKDILRIAKERADAEIFVGKSSTDKKGVGRDPYGNPLLTYK